MQVEDTINDPWPASQETRTAGCDKNGLSFCPPVAVANIQRMLGHITEDMSRCQM